MPSISPWRMGHTGVLLTVVAAFGCGGGSSPAAPNPSSDQQQSAIGSGGGTVSFAGDTVRLIVPAGALAAATNISIRATQAVPLDPSAVGNASYEVLPAGISFAVPATLTITYQASLGPSGTAPEEWRLHQLAGSAWTGATGTSDASKFTVSGEIRGAGTFGVRWPGPAGPCALPEDRQFDFWLGSWNLVDVTAGGAGVPAGTNEITRDSTGCLIVEHYTAAGTGRSISLFSRIDRRWHQTYVDTFGTRVQLIGAANGARLLLQSGGTRSYWEPIDANAVRFVQEQSRDNGLTWTPFFVSVYQRR